MLICWQIARIRYFQSTLTKTYKAYNNIKHSKLTFKAIIKCYSYILAPLLLYYCYRDLTMTYQKRERTTPINLILQHSLKMIEECIYKTLEKFEYKSKEKGSFYV